MAGSGIRVLYLHLLVLALELRKYVSASCDAWRLPLLMPAVVGVSEMLFSGPPCLTPQEVITDMPLTRLARGSTRRASFAGSETLN
jgi:hypothetical protein